jgi:ABC-2 type transport system permease protein
MGRSGARAVLRLIAAQARMSALAALQYRLGFWTEGLLGALWSAIGVIPLLVATSYQEAVAGWGPWELMAVTGLFMVFSGIFGALLQPALIESMEHIRRGSLDALLLRPVDALALCLTAAFSPWRLTEAAAGAALLVVALVKVGAAPDLWMIGAALVVIAAGIVGLYALGILALCASFLAMQLQNLTYLFDALLDFARWPSSVFKGPLKALFTFVVPFAVMTTMPAEALLGRLAAVDLGIAVVVAAGLLVIARRCWSASLQRYASAGGLRRLAQPGAQTRSNQAPQVFGSRGYHWPVVWLHHWTRPGSGAWQVEQS